jgi:hypothetical protein
MAAAGKAKRAFNFDILNLPFNIPATKTHGGTNLFTQMSDKL